MFNDFSLKPSTFSSKKYTNLKVRLEFYFEIFFREKSIDVSKEMKLQRFQLKKGGKKDFKNCRILKFQKYRLQTIYRTRSPRYIIANIETRKARSK